jgi:hypothetical protein
MEDNTQGSAPIADVSTTAPAQEGQDPSIQTDQTAQLEAAAQNGTPKQQAVAKKMLKEIKFKANGQDFTETLPFEVPEEHLEYMQKHFSLNKGAQTSMQKYSQLEREIKDFAAKAKTDTKGALKLLGINPSEFAAAMLEEELKMQSLTPEQRELEEAKKELQALKAKQETDAQEFSKKELERVTQLEYDRISTKIEKAITTSGLPQEPAIVKRLANYMLIGNQMNVKFEPEELVEIVREDMYNELQGLIKHLGADKVEQLVGKDILTEIRKKNIAKAKTTPATAKGTGVKDVGATKTAPATAEKKSYKEFFKF